MCWQEAFGGPISLETFHQRCICPLLSYYLLHYLPASTSVLLSLSVHLTSSINHPSPQSFHGNITFLLCLQVQNFLSISQKANLICPSKPKCFEESHIFYDVPRGEIHMRGCLLKQQHGRFHQGAFFFFIGICNIWRGCNTVNLTQ